MSRIKATLSSASSTPKFSTSICDCCPLGSPSQSDQQDFVLVEVAYSMEPDSSSPAPALSPSQRKQQDSDGPFTESALDAFFEKLMETGEFQGFLTPEQLGQVIYRREFTCGFSAPRPINYHHGLHRLRAEDPLSYCLLEEWARSRRGHSDQCLPDYIAIRGITRYGQDHTFVGFFITAACTWKLIHQVAKYD
ncbi:hypothetical protein PCASD_09514 [Puccinia coronata f. sp. avenae]|uniref:Uncharacterized protein n=1 Tax=Puccinia coronata f. sp. avenae TaxID=200324 RepID=A0A2N5U650_9BASI|nr:hypothetical protein PCASD_09514 [Puccinia coronata f. sp. avenae]